MALGLLQCLVYPSILRASVFGAHPRFLIESAWLQPPEQPPPRASQRAAAAGAVEEQGHSLPVQTTRTNQCKARSREAFRRATVGYLTLFPAITFVRSPLHEKLSRDGGEAELQEATWQAHRSIVRRGGSGCAAAAAVGAPPSAADAQLIVQAV